MSASPPSLAYGGFTAEQVYSLAGTITQIIQAQLHPPPPYFAGSSQHATLRFNGALPPFYPHPYRLSPQLEPEDHSANRDQHSLSASFPVRNFTALDEIALIDKIREGNRSYKSLQEIMESLSNVNGHNSVEWAEYFLQNSTRITGLTTSSFSSSFMRSERNQLSTDSAPVPPSSKSRSFKARHSRAPMRALSPLPSRRRGSRRESAFAQQAPTPPAIVVQTSQRNKYTPADIKYFRDFLKYYLQKNPACTNVEIFKRLSENVPHHTQGSWAAYASSHENRALIQKIRRQVVDDQYGNENAGDDICSDSESEQMSESPENVDADFSSDGKEDTGEDSSDSSSEHSDAESNPKSTISRREWKGTTDFHQDKVLVAEFIAKDKKWFTPDRMAKWDQFARERGSHRTAVRWEEFFQKNKAEIHRLVQTLKVKATKSTTHVDSDDDESPGDRFTPGL